MTPLMFELAIEGVPQLRDGTTTSGKSTLRSWEVLPRTWPEPVALGPRKTSPLTILVPMLIFPESETTSPLLLVPLVGRVESELSAKTMVLPVPVIVILLWAATAARVSGTLAVVSRTARDR